MYSLRDDTNIDVTRHQDLLYRSQHYPDQATPLKTRISRFYRLILAHAGRKMVAWGYQIHEKSGVAGEIPLLTPPYAIENRS
jgi:hypothetical protein